MTVPTLKHMYTTVYAVHNGQMIYRVFSDETLAIEYVKTYDGKIRGIGLEIYKTVLEIAV